MVELKITIDELGRMSVSGPIDNLAMCYGLLEMAKDTLRQRTFEKQQLVQPVSGVLRQ